LKQRARFSETLAKKHHSKQSSKNIYKKVKLQMEAAKLSKLGAVTEERKVTENSTNQPSIITCNNP
jgi:hypothetical protein